MDAYKKKRVVSDGFIIREKGAAIKLLNAVGGGCVLSGFKFDIILTRAKSVPRHGRRGSAEAMHGNWSVRYRFPD